MPQYTREQKHNYLHRYSQTLIKQGYSFNQFYKATKGTTLGTRRSTALSIYQEEKREYTIQQKFSRSRKDKIDYENLPFSQSKTLKKYSFTVQRGYLLDDDGKYIKDKKGNKIADYVTVITNRKLSRSEIKEKAESIPTGKQGTKGHGHKGRVRIISGIRNVMLRR